MNKRAVNSSEDDHEIHSSVVNQFAITFNTTIIQII